MKLTNKEKIILAVFLSIVIIVAGVFVFILPEYNKIDPNKSSLQAKKDEYDNILGVLARESTIDQEIQTAYDKANKFSTYFYDDLTILDADELTRKILADTNMKTKGLSISDFSTSTLTVSEYVETYVTYPLKEYSGFKEDTGIDFSQYQITYDENGNIVVPDEMKQVLKDYLNAILLTQSQTIGSITVSLTVEGKMSDFLDFLNYIADLEQATYIPSVSIDYGAEDNNPAPAQTTGAAEEQRAASALDKDKDVSMGITLTYYCVKPLQTETSAAETTAPVTTPAA